MKLNSILLITITLVAALIAFAAPALAGPPAGASGLWQYQPFPQGVRQAGCNTFITTFENGIWSGAFEGASTEEGQVVIHCSGRWSFNAIVTFEEVTVDGRSGGLEMSVNGSRPDGMADWEGMWVILSGSDDLRSLRGQGTWWGPGASGPGMWGDIYYAGNIHFDPG